MFGKKKKKETEVEEPIEETPDLEVEQEEIDSGDEELEETKRKLAEAEEKLKETEKPKSKPEPTIKAEVQIIQGELLEKGIHRYTVISNKSLGEIGDKFPLD